MIGEIPKFFDSPYFVDEPGNWHLKPGAPKEIVNEFNQYMKADLNTEKDTTAKTFGDLMTD